MKTILKISLLLTASFLLTGCFQVSHFLALNPDGSISIKWRLSISSALSKKNLRSKKGPDMQEKLNKANQELQTQLKGKARDLKSSLINTKYEKGVAMELTLLKPVRLEKQDALPVVPFYEPAKKRLTFFFLYPKKQGKSTLPIPPAPPKRKTEEAPNREESSNEHPSTKKEPSEKQENVPSPRPKNQGMEELAKAILSSARYQILLGGQFAPKRAYIIDHNQNEKQTELEIRKLGSQYLLDFPFMSFHFTGKEGYDLIVEMK